MAYVFASTIASIGALLCAFVLVQNRLEVSRLRLVAQYAYRPQRGKLLMRGYVNGEDSVLFSGEGVQFINDTEEGKIRFHANLPWLKPGTVVEVRAIR